MTIFHPRRIPKEADDERLLAEDSLIDLEACYCRSLLTDGENHETVSDRVTGFPEKIRTG
jgi:hypothetical protein